MRNAIFAVGQGGGSIFLQFEFFAALLEIVADAEFELVEVAAGVVYRNSGGGFVFDAHCQNVMLLHGYLIGARSPRAVYR